MYSTNQRRIVRNNFLKKLAVTDRRRCLTSKKLSELITRNKLTKIKDILTADLQQIALSDGTTYKFMIEDPGDNNHLTWLGCPSCIVAAKSTFLTPELIVARTYELCDSNNKDARKDIEGAR